MRSITLFLYVLLITLGCKKHYDPPIASFTFANNNCEGPCEVTFINQSQLADSYAWEFGDGNKSTEKNPRNTFQKGGTYTVTLTAMGKGGSASYSETITIKTSIPKPTADFDLQYVGNGQVRVISKSSNASTYQWSFGDGGSAVGSDIHYTYKNNGSYIITLVATGTGGQASISKNAFIDTIPTTGSGIVYLLNNVKSYVSVSVNGTTEGNITVYDGSTVPTCGDTGYVTFTRPAGVYNISAKAQSGEVWQTTMTIVNGQCTKLALQ
ncbi:MAG: PKD domain-containing protein [Siphonobacter sp.]